MPSCWPWSPPMLPTSPARPLRASDAQTHFIQVRFTLETMLQPCHKTAIIRIFTSGLSHLKERVTLTCSRFDWNPVKPTLSNMRRSGHQLPPGRPGSSARPCTRKRRVTTWGPAGIRLSVVHVSWPTFLAFPKCHWAVAETVGEIYAATRGHKKRKPGCTARQDRGLARGPVWRKNREPEGRWTPVQQAETGTLADSREQQWE